MRRYSRRLTGAFSWHVKTRDHCGWPCSRTPSRTRPARCEKPTAIDRPARGRSRSHPLVRQPLGPASLAVAEGFRVTFLELLKSLHSAFLPSSHSAPVIFAGALGGMGGLNSGMPVMCSTQLQTSLG